MIENEGVLALVFSLPAILLIAFTLVDVFRRRDLSSGRKILWLVVVVLLPGIGALIHLISRPFRDPAINPATVEPKTEELVRALERYERGESSDDVFAAAKAEIFRTPASG